MYAHWLRHPGQFIKRRSRILSSLFLACCLIFIHQHSSHHQKSQRKSFDDVKGLLIQLFDPSIGLKDLQRTWNELIKIWRNILQKFLHDACELCHPNQFDCPQSLDLVAYINQINQSFYPFNASTRPYGMGINYYFDLQTFHSLNHSLLPTDVTFCDYFHLIRLFAQVQTILHRGNIEYFLTKGTLLGTLRHHDVIPWDGDIDLFIPISSVKKCLKIFSQLKKSNSTRGNDTQDLVIYRFRNIYGMESYKIFSLRSPRVNGTDYRWPKIDLFPYQENSTHISAYPKHQHNLGTMSSMNRTDIHPLYPRLLGPLLVPSPYHPRKSLKAMIKLGRSDLFDVCEGNRYSDRDNQQLREPWRVPCKELHQSYLFVQSQRNASNGLCSEQLISSQRNETLSFYLYQCDEYLPRTLTD